MEPKPSANKNSGGNGTGSSRPQSVSAATQNNINPPDQKYKHFKNDQFGPSLYKGDVNILPAGGARNASDLSRSLSTASTADTSHEGEVSSKRFTAQTLHELDLQQAARSSLFKFWDATQQGHVTGLKAGAATQCDHPTYDLHAEGTRDFKMTLFDDPLAGTLIHRDQTQSQQKSIASTYNEADFDTATCQGTDRWPRYSHQEHIVDTPGYDEYDIESLYWNMDPDRELTAWGNDLFGIGEHLAGSYQEYATGDDFVMDLFSH